MAYKKEYWNDKEKRAEQARSHTKAMQELHGEKIAEAVKNTKIYDTDFMSEGNNTCDCESCITVEPLDSVSSIMKHANDCKGRMAVLNFSS